MTPINYCKRGVSDLFWNESKMRFMVNLHYVTIIFLLFIYLSKSALINFEVQSHGAQCSIEDYRK